MTINRITFTENAVKGFEGRTKTDEVEVTLEGKAYDKFFDAAETKLADAKWETEKNGVWRKGDAGDDIEDLVFVSKLLKKLTSGKVVEIKGNKKDKKEKTPKSDVPVDKKKMKIMKEQRKRRTLRTKMEDALDDYVIDMIKSRRVLMYENLVKVAKENGITIKGMDNGHRKMNVQNSLRARYLREESVFIDGAELRISKAELKKHLEAAEEGEEEAA